MIFEVQTYKKVKGNQDPRNPTKHQDVLVGKYTVNVTNLSAATAFRKYGTATYGQKELRTSIPLDDFDYCLIGGKKYVVQERQTVNYRQSILVKEA
ncbi:hypothetical protein [Fructobacillus evanidus]|uniref:Phage protein n=1 Tax=Fructobacillus evanidus TaxID=3064281 RepID=A0ABM9MM84_9LACO|nr:unnamed protein product [Fructobacillus sp. LMG 32999]CAK1222235.1 unnamed protein product [Fructobacillus sp. LMG 32999]CAK1225663.1 unnamed protein product [Fructobacillus sp. LMG 32999]CAK1225881.1 unnamed protein product [Fructobacillus sp. LMG 32999]CAK1226015.1 unnamed protein product [Fructobacillus sp. LMG 32999]